jgi:AcrR family transcriptional regulator
MSDSALEARPPLPPFDESSARANVLGAEAASDSRDPDALAADDRRDDVLRAADELFYRNGISAVTMADIRDRSGVAFRRLYSLFPRKADLVTGWLTRRHDTWMAMFEAGIDDRLADGSGTVDAIFGSLEAWLVATEFRGCGFINTLAETGEVTEEHRAVIRAHKQALVDSLRRYTDQPMALAVLIDGAIVQASVFASTASVAAARSAAKQLIGSNEPVRPVRRSTRKN